MTHVRRGGTIALISTFWGEDESEQIAVARLVAGALARTFRVEVFHLDEQSIETSTSVDSAFLVHTYPVSLPHPAQYALLHRALGSDDSTALPDSLEQALWSDVHVAGDLIGDIDMLDPDIVLICGTVHPYALGRLRKGRERRIVFMPVSTSLARLRDRHVEVAMQLADVVLCSHPGELRMLKSQYSELEKNIVPLDLALSVNRGATSDTLFGVRFFQPFVLLIRQFGDATRRDGHVLTHEIITSVAGTLRREDLPEDQWRSASDEIAEVLPISVAEVDGDAWRLSDNINMLPLPVSPTRVNLWRLMAHALFTIDLRPSSAFGRETIESLMFDSPVIVPDHSAAKEHAEAANAGLWYRNNGEVLDAVRVLTDRAIRERFARNGRAYVDAHHSDLPGFVERICSLVDPSMPR